jgi:hypothetical protein
MSWYAVLVAAFAAAAGFAAGLLLFRIKQRWCPVCGATFDCPDRALHPNGSREQRSHHVPKRNAAPAAAQSLAGPRCRDRAGPVAEPRGGGAPGR